MEYIGAKDENIDRVFEIVQTTVQAVYPKYYHTEVVNFFCALHNRENIAKDIACGNAGVLVVNHQIVGTGCRDGNHITRVYVLPEFQGKGYGSFIMQCLEDQIAETYDAALLDASLPAVKLYEHRGYHTIQHQRYPVGNGVVLIYEVMEKLLPDRNARICYEGKKFSPRLSTENGEVNEETIFCFHQQGDELWGEYTGGVIRRGALVGCAMENGELDFYYQHLNRNNQIRAGKCHSIPRLLDNGKLELLEQWQWLDGDLSQGSSIVTEL